MSLAYVCIQFMSKGIFPFYFHIKDGYQHTEIDINISIYIYIYIYIYIIDVCVCKWIDMIWLK